MTASMRSETCAKTVCSEVFGIFSRTLVTNQVPDPSSTGYWFLEYRLYGEFVFTMLGDRRCVSHDVDTCMYTAVTQLCITEYYF